MTKKPTPDEIASVERKLRRARDTLSARRERFDDDHDARARALEMLQYVVDLMEKKLATMQAEAAT